MCSKLFCFTHQVPAAKVQRPGWGSDSFLCFFYPLMNSVQQSQQAWFVWAWQYGSVVLQAVTSPPPPPPPPPPAPALGIGTDMGICSANGTGRLLFFSIPMGGRGFF